jgi:hypothetical protein
LAARSGTGAANLLETALARLTGDDRDRAEEGLVYALNAALVANAVSLDDVEEVRGALGDARATLSLGLELLSSGDVDAAARALAHRPVRDIFQAGLSEPYRLQSRARRIAQSARLPQAQTVTLLNPPLSDAVEALQRKRPMWPDPGSPRRRRALGTRAEVALAEQMLDEAEAVVALLRELGIGPAELGGRAESAGIAPTALRASDAVRALAVQRLRGDAQLPLGDDAAPEGLQRTMDELLQGAARTVGTEAAKRAAARLRDQALKSPR